MDPGSTRSGSTVPPPKGQSGTLLVASVPSQEARGQLASPQILLGQLPWAKFCSRCCETALNPKDVASTLMASRLQGSSEKGLVTPVASKVGDSWTASVGKGSLSVQSLGGTGSPGSFAQGGKTLCNLSHYKLTSPPDNPEPPCLSGGPERAPRLPGSRFFSPRLSTLTNFPFFSFFQ